MGKTRKRHRSLSGSRKVFPLMVFMIFSGLVTRPVHARGPWETAIIGGIEGYNAAGTGLYKGEYLRIGLYHDPWAPFQLRPSLWAGMLVPFNPFDMASAMLGGGIEVQYFGMRVSDAVFVRQWRYSPSVSADLMFAGSGGGAGVVLLGAQPLRFWFGDSFMSFLGTELVMGWDGKVKGWGMSLLKFISFVN